MALINEHIKKNLANNLVANYDENGDGTSVNGQPLQVTQYGNLTTTNRLEYAQIGATYSGTRTNIAHDVVGSMLEQLMAEMVAVMGSSGYNYAYNVQTYVVPDVGSRNIYNLYITAWLSNY